ncbi:MAG: hypothetical protein AAF394_07110 [Planctomycetota bacterium]
MTRETFNWDQYLEDAPYRDVRERSPELSSRRPPQLYNPTRTLFYVPTLDMDVRVDHFKELCSALQEVLKCHRRYQKLGDIGHLAMTRRDVFELCSLLQACAEDPLPYLDPEELMANSG